MKTETYPSPETETNAPPDHLKKVLVVVRPAAGGMLSHVQGILKYLPDYGYQATLIGPDIITDRPNPLTDRRAARALLERSQSFDVIHAHGVRAGWVSALAYKNQRPWLWTVHHLLRSQSAVVRAAWRWIAKYPHQIIAVSEPVRQGLVAGGVPSEKIVVIGGGMDLTRFEKLPERESIRSQYYLTDDKPIILLAGRFVPEKGYGTAIQAMETVWERLPQAELWMAGEGPDNGRLIKQASRASKPGQIRFFGYFSYINELYVAADLLAAPATHAGLGSAIMEAMACGLPIVASDIEQHRDLVEHERTGLLTPPDNPAALGETMVRMLVDHDLSRRLTTNAQQIIERFDIRHMVEKTAQQYQFVEKR